VALRRHLEEPLVLGQWVWVLLGHPLDLLHTSQQKHQIRLKALVLVVLALAGQPKHRKPLELEPEVLQQKTHHVIVYLS
jgi:hypothetical protein